MVCFPGYYMLYCKREGAPKHFATDPHWLHFAREPKQSARVEGVWGSRHEASKRRNPDIRVTWELCRDITL